MLVLSRKKGEVITIGASVTVTILGIDRGVVRLGIEAPKSIPVHRKEIHDKIVEINRQAVKTEFNALKKAISKARILLKNELQSNNVIEKKLNNLEIFDDNQNK